MVNAEQRKSIQVLPQNLIDQIAAGEVVERPASVLKELIENALDAGSTHVEVRVYDGGIQKIQILDNGFGIPKDELALALQRHTTSKISKLADLEKMKSYGFRGEALSSISSVSQLTLRSRTNRSDKAWEIFSDCGKISAPQTKAGQSGTCITVEGLFEKVPARQKFLRSPSTEFSHCARVLKEIALGCPNVSLSLFHQDRAIQHYRNPTRAGRVSECLKISWEPMQIAEETPDFALEAFLSPPELVTDKGEVLWVINGRCVNHRGFQSALRNAYRDTLGPHHIPSGVVYLDIRPDWVDVNVHPQKTEVRILKQERIYPWILSLVRKAIAKARTLREVEVPKESYRISEANVDVKLNLNEVPAPTFRRPIPQALFEDIDQLPRRVEIEAPSPIQSVRKFRYLGQIKASYLVCEDAEGLLVVDQHALHEKLFFEKLVDKLEKGDLEIQRLLVPKVLSVEPEWLSLIEEHQAVLSRFGFEIEIVGDADLAVKSRPALVKEERLEPVIKEILRELSLNPKSAKERSSSFHQAVRPLLATIACHSVIRANHFLSDREAEELLGQADDIQLGQTCPHGRPVMFRLGFKTIEKHFER